MRTLSRPIPTILLSSVRRSGGVECEGSAGPHRLIIECHVLSADSINKNTETHEEKTIFKPGTISPHVQLGVINQKLDSLSTLIDPRFSSIERLSARETSGRTPALGRLL